MGSVNGSKPNREHLIPVGVGVTVFGLYVWLAFHAYGYDWQVSELFGEVLVNAAKPAGGFPYFSYFYNGGIYFPHDPQAWVTSPLFHLFVSLTGPEAGARWLGVAYGTLGFSATYAWLRLTYSRSISTYGALALSLSLGMFWRMVAGHMLFLLEMMLPFFLLAVARIEDARTPSKRLAWIFGMALAGAWMIYEPGFHALFYFILPCLFFDLLVRFASKPREFPRLFRALLVSGSLAGLLILPKIIMWRSLAMTRAPDPTDGTLAFKDLLVALFVTARAAVMGFHVPGSNPERWHFIFEVNTALMPIASLFALFGLGLGLYRKHFRNSTFSLGLLCLVFSLLVSGNQTVWETVQSITSGGIRVPSRYLALGAFGLMLLSVYGIEWVARKWRWVPVFASCLVILLAGDWLHRAQKVETLRAVAYPQSNRSDLPEKYRLGKYCPVASGCLNTYQPGYDQDPYIRYLTVNQITEENIASRIPASVTVHPTLISLTDVKPSAVIDLPLRGASFGERVVTYPAGLSARIETNEGHLRIYGDPNRPIERLEITPAFPAPISSLWISGIAVLLSLLGLVYFSLFSAAEHTEAAPHPLGRTTGRGGE